MLRLSQRFKLFLFTDRANALPHLRRRTGSYADDLPIPPRMLCQRAHDVLQFLPVLIVIFTAAFAFAAVMGIVPRFFAGGRLCLNKNFIALMRFDERQRINTVRIAAARGNPHVIIRPVLQIQIAQKKPRFQGILRNVLSVNSLILSVYDLKPPPESRGRTCRMRKAKLCKILGNILNLIPILVGAAHRHSLILGIIHHFPRSATIVVILAFPTVALRVA